MKKRLAIFLCLFLALSGFKYDDSSNQSGQWPGATAVAHAMGEIDDRQYAFSYETFMRSYKKGFRTYEVDFQFTTDDYVVLTHMWGNPTIQEGIDKNHIPSLEKYMNTKVLGKYTPLAWTDLCDLMMQYNDTYVIVDIKMKDNAETVKFFKEIVKEAKNEGAEDVLDRLCICIYNQSEYIPISSVYPFKNYIYTTYKEWNGNADAFRKYCQFSQDNGFQAISMWSKFYNAEIQSIADQYGLDVYLHNENDLNAAKKYISMGARGVYTDYINPADLGGAD